MWLVAICLLLAIIYLLALGRSASLHDQRNHAADDNSELGMKRRARDRSDRSVIPNKSVQLSLATGAPPIPWIPSKDDAHTMLMIQRYFARAIPNPTRDGRPFVEETIGHGGPQLELYVPIVSIRKPVAVLVRDWDAASRALVANLYFAGTVEGRLAEIVHSLGFDHRSGSSDGSLTVYRSRRGFFRQRAG
jgi:hypothetical protein